MRAYFMCSLLRRGRIEYVGLLLWLLPVMFTQKSYRWIRETLKRIRMNSL